MPEFTELPLALAGCLDACRRCAQIAGSAGRIAFENSETGESSVGAHLRHCIEHFQCFFEGLPDGAVNYDARARDVRLESERTYFLKALETVMQQLDQLAPHDIAQAIKVTQIASDAGEPVEVTSSVERELIFLSGHTIHHLALIDLVLRSKGIAVGEDVAMAFSTAAYQRASS